MKKILALLMIFAVSLSLFACGKADGDGKENTTENTAAVDKTEDTSAEVTTAAEMKNGDEGNGPADIDAEFITLKLPSGYKYEVDSFSKDSNNPLYGDVTLYIYKDGSYSSIATLTATTRNMVRSQEEAVENTIKLCNLQTYKTENLKSAKMLNTVKTPIRLFMLQQNTMRRTSLLHMQTEVHRIQRDFLSSLKSIIRISKLTTRLSKNFLTALR